MAEKSLNSLNRDLRVIYTRGHDALVRDNFDYAIDLFNQVLAKEPGLFECRRELRSAQFKKSGGGGGFFKKMLSSAGSQPVIARGQMALHKNPAEALQIAEQILNNDPENSGAHRIVVEAAAALELPNTAVMSLEVLHRNSPKDKDVAVKFGNALADIGEAPRAERILSELLRQYPGDNDLAQALKNLSARKTMDEGGYEALADGSGSYRDILRNKEEAVSLEQQNRQVKSEDTASRLILEYEERLKREPTNIKVLRDLADLYTQKSEFDKALSFYQRIKQLDVGGDPGLDRAMAETVLRRYDHKIASLDPNAPDHAEETARLQAEKKAFALAECQSRVERYPTDLQFRFELAEQYLDSGKISEATAEFQKAEGNPHRRVAAMRGLAECFARGRKYDLAARKLQSAIKEKVVFDDEKKELIYNLGVILDKMGKKEEAIEQFKLIYEVDIGYKDVGSRVDAHYASQAEEQAS